MVAIWYKLDMSSAHVSNWPEISVNIQKMCDVRPLSWALSVCAYACVCSVCLVSIYVPACECTYTCFCVYASQSLCVCPCVSVSPYVCVSVSVCVFVHACMYTWMAFTDIPCWPTGYVPNSSTAGESTTIRRTSLNTDNRWHNLNTSPDAFREKGIAV